MTARKRVVEEAALICAVAASRFDPPFAYCTVDAADDLGIPARAESRRLAVEASMTATLHNVTRAEHYAEAECLLRTGELDRLLAGTGDR